MRLCLLHLKSPASLFACLFHLYVHIYVFSAPLTFIPTGAIEVALEV